MSTTLPTRPVAETQPVPLLPERRTLVAVLVALETLLLGVGSVLAYLYRSQPVPAYGNSGGGPTCVQPLGPGATPTGPYPSPCGPGDTTAQAALLVAAVCTSVALLVLPAVIGALSRRWQTALSAPSIPVWVALLAVVAVALATNAGALAASGGSFTELYPVAFTLTLAGPLLSLLLATVGLGGLGWLARRAFAR